MVNPGGCTADIEDRVGGWKEEIHDNDDNVLHNRAGNLAKWGSFLGLHCY